MDTGRSPLVARLLVEAFMVPKARFFPVAVVGIACVYPGAHTPAQLWENILARRRQFRRIPDSRMPVSDYFSEDPSEPDKTYGKKAAVIDGFQFDWAGRRVPFSTYETTDISHWLALETAMAAIADAGYDRESIPGERTGVLVGNSLTGEQTRANTMRLRWPFVRRAFRAAARETGMARESASRIEEKLEGFYKSVFPPVNEDTLAGGLSNTIAGRICNFLNLYGGGYTVDGACSSSLLAISTGTCGLVTGDLDLAIAGGVDISLDPFELVGFSKTGALTPKDMSVYDRGGSGFIPGEGCGFVVLKRLEDAKRDRRLYIRRDSRMGNFVRRQGRRNHRAQRPRTGEGIAGGIRPRKNGHGQADISGRPRDRDHRGRPRRTGRHRPGHGAGRVAGRGSPSLLRR